MLGLFRRRSRLSAAAERRVLIALARAEESVVRTHVRGALKVVHAVGAELPLEHALELYLDGLDVDEPQATIVTQRVLSRFSDEDDDDDEDDEDDD